MIFSLLVYYFLFVGLIKAATFNSIEGYGMQSLFRGQGSSSLTLNIPTSQFYDAAIVGYFKYTTFDPALKYSMMRYQSEQFTFLQYYALGPTPYLIAQNDVDQYQAIIQPGPSMVVGNWYQFGFGYKHAIKSWYQIYQPYPQGAITIAQNIFVNPIRSDITQIQLCIFCTPLEYQYNKFIGFYASIKMILGFTIDAAKLLLNEWNMSNTILRGSFYINTDVINYTKTQYQPVTADLAVNCLNSTKIYFDGVCIDPSQCANVVVYQNTQYGVSNSVYFNQAQKQCVVCSDYCAQCDQNGNCLSCTTGYVLNASNNSCQQCSSSTYYNPLNSLCVAICPSGYVADTINIICVQNFNPFYLLFNPLLSPRNFVQNNGFILTDQSQSTLSDQFTQCWLENQSFGAYTILGGQSNTNTNYFIKQIQGLPKNFQKIITFQALIYNNGLQGDFNLFVNNNQIVLSSYQQIFTNQQLCTDNQQVNYYQLTYIIKDSSTNLNIKISSNKNGWGIRNFSMNITKCHSTCQDCTTDGNPWSCTTCQKQPSAIIINNNCACQKGQYAQFQNCYSSPCYACANCPPNCLSCEDQTGKCTSCANGFSIQNGICISSSSCPTYYINDPGSSYCFRSKDLYMKFFWQNRIYPDVQFWAFTPQQQIDHICTNQLFAPFLNGQTYTTLTLPLLNYQQYHYQVEIQLVATNIDTFILTDYVSYYINNQLVKKANYHSTSTTSLCDDASIGETLVNEDLFLPTTSTTLNFKIQAYLVGSTGFTFNNFAIIFNRCHASCSSCNDGSSCSQCIANSSLDATKGNFCYCSNGYYFTYDWNTSSGLCLPCNNFCQTCNGPSITDCLSCKESFQISNGICVNACQTNQFWDFTQHKCINCSECCASCTGPNSNQCSSCQSGLMTYNAPVCKFNSDGSTCNSCTSNVSNSLCGGTQTNNQFCQQNGYVSYNASTCIYCPTADASGNCGGSSVYNTQCNYYGFYYSQTAGKCLSCSQAQGTQCGDPSISSTCQQNKWIYQSLSTCISCVLQSSPLCCNSACMTCNGSGANNCLSCYGSQVLFNNTCLDKCPNGYSLQSDNTCKSCLIFVGVAQCNNCSSDCNTCAAATTTQCQTCYNSRQFNQATKRCDCKDQEDTRNFFYECSINNQAVLDIQLQDNAPTMIIDFGKILLDLPQFPSQTKSNGVCLAIFSSNDMKKIGQNALCQIQFNILTVTLDMTATVMQGDTLDFIQNVLQFKINSSSPINKFLNNVVAQKPPQNPGIVFNYNKVENSCNDFKISQFKILNDSGRGLKSITWSLQNPSSSQEDSNIQSILSQASQQIQSSILIPKGTVSLNSQKTISVSYLFKNSYSGSQQFIFQIQSFKNIVSSLSSNINTPYYRFEDFTLQLSYYTQFCNQQGISLNNNDPVNVQINSPQSTQINISQQGQTQGQLSQQIQAYTFASNQNNQINAVLTLSTDSTVTNTQQIQFFTQPADLIVKINGGNQKIDYKSSLKLSGTIRDLDVADPNADQGITQVWSCSDPSNVNSPCVDQNNKPFVLDSNNPQILPDTFSPYTVIKVYLSGKKSGRQSSDSIIVLFIEFDLPVLNVSLKLLDPFGQSVNLNEEIFAILNYDTTVNPDILSFSSTIVYGDGVVGAIKFDYTQLRYRLWDYYSGFSSSNPTVTIRFSVFNPYYFMPSISIINLKINFPPTQCQFIVSPLPSLSNPAFSLQTLFTLSVSGCVDTNLPLSYQFFMYKSKQDLQNEIQYPSQVNRRQLTDQQPDTSLSTILPAGNIVLMAVVADSLQAVFNSTINLTVQSSNLNENQYISLIDNDLNTNGQTSQQTISQLSLIAEDLSQRSDLSTSVQINQRKILIIDALNKATSQLPTLSTFSTLSNKAVSSLFSSINLSVQEQANQLTNIQQAVSQDWSQTPYQSLTDTQKQIKTQQIYDYFKIIDNMATSSPSQDSNVLNLQVDVSTKLGQKMNYNSLPNEDPKIYQGSTLSIQSQQVTEKNLCSYLFCSSYEPSNTQKQQIIYNVAYKTYKQNPYIDDPSFQNFTNLLNQNIGNQTVVQYPVINPEILPSSTPSATSPINVFSNSYTFAANSVKDGLSCFQKSNGIWNQTGCKLVYNSKSNSQTCLCDRLGPTTIVNDLQQLINNKNLQTAFGSQGLKNISQFSNFYKYVAFWLLVVKTAGFIILYIKGSKLDEAFINTKLNGRITTQVSINQVLPIQYDNIKEVDQENANKIQQKSIQEDSPQQQKESFNNKNYMSARNLGGQSSFQNLKTQVQIIQKPTLNNFIQSAINEKPEIQKNEINNQQNQRKQITLNDKQVSLIDENQNLNTQMPLKEKESQLKNEKINKQPSIDDFNLLQTKQSGENFLKSQNKSDLNQAENNSAENEGGNLNSQNKGETSSPKYQTEVNIPESKEEKDNSDEDKQMIDLSDEQYSEKTKKFMELNNLKQILFFHNFFSIFLIYDQKMPRKLRFSCFYVRIIHSFAISVIFNSSYDVIQLVALSIANAIIISVSLQILELVNKYLGKYALAVTLIGLLGLYYYVILSIVSGESVESSNLSIGSYFIFTCFDLIVVSFLLAYLQRFLALKTIKKEKLQNFPKKIFEFLHLQLILTSLL